MPNQKISADTAVALTPGMFIPAIDMARAVGSQNVKVAGCAFSSLFTTPQQFGAKGDGTTDDTAAIQAAFNSGGTIFIPKATYIVSSTITINTPGQTIFGSGQGTVILTGNTTTDVFVLTVAGVEIHSFVIRASGTRTNGYYINIGNTGYHNIYNMLFQGWNLGIRMAGAAVAGIRISNITMNLGQGLGSGIVIDGGVDVVISDVAISGTSAATQIGSGVSVFSCGDVTLRHILTVYAGDGLSIAPPAGKVVQCLNVFDCLFDSGSGAAIDVQAPGGAVQMLKISRSWAATSTSGGIILNTSSGGVIQQTDIVDCIVSNANPGAAAHGILIASASVTGTSIIGCSIAANTGSGIYIVANVRKFRIADNTIGLIGEFAGNYGYGITILSGCDEFSIHDNDIISNGMGAVNIPAGFFAGTGTSRMMHHNLGALTSNGGTATITTGATSVTFPHGLLTQPNTVLLGPTSQLYSASVTTTATNITITISAAQPGATPVYWEAKVSTNS